MNGFTEFLAMHYVWFIIITVILILALIGYLVDAHEIKSGKVKNTKDSELKIVDFSTVDQSKSLGASIQDAEANNLNLNNYTSDQTPAATPGVPEAPVAPEGVATPPEAADGLITDADVKPVENSVAQPEDPSNPMYGSTTDYQPTQSLEKSEIPIVTPEGETPTEQPAADGPINPLAQDDSESSINVV